MKYLLKLLKFLFTTFSTQLETIIYNQEKIIMMADDLMAALAALQETAHAIEVKLAEPPVVVGTSDAALQPVLDGMKAVNDSLKAALVPAV